MLKDEQYKNFYISKYSSLRPSPSTIFRVTLVYDWNLSQFPTDKHASRLDPVLTKITEMSSAPDPALNPETHTQTE